MFQMCSRFFKIIQNCTRLLKIVKKMFKNFQNKKSNLYKIDTDCTHFSDCLRLFKNVEVFIKLFMTVNEN